jgi:hypothetical protein
MILHEQQTLAAKDHASSSGQRASPPSSFICTIGPCDESGRCPTRASGNGRDVASALFLSEALVDLGWRALHTDAQHIEDVHDTGLALGRALFTAPIRALILEAAHTAAAQGARVQVRLQINSPELAALPWEYLTLGSVNVWQPALRADYTLVRVGTAHHAATAPAATSTAVCAGSCITRQPPPSG